MVHKSKEEFQAYQLAYRPAHREERRLYSKAYHKAHREQKRAYDLAKRYGLTAEEWTSFYKQQDGQCAICSKPLTENDVVVDHCHITEKVRGLLCHACNRGLGSFNDSPELLLKAYQYLVSQAALQLLG